MSNIFFYEPFYDLDRLLDDSWVTRGGSNSTGNNQQVARQEDSGRNRAFRPKCVLIFFALLPRCSLLTQNGFARRH